MIHPNTKFVLTLCSGFVLMLNGIFYFDNPGKYLTASVLGEEGSEKEVITPSTDGEQETSVDDAKEKKEGELYDTTKVLLGENRNGIETFYGYKAGDLETEDLLKYAYERRTASNKKRSGIRSQSLTTPNYQLLSARSQYKSAAPWTRTSTLNENLQKNSVAVPVRTKTMAKPKDTLESRRVAGVRRLEPVELKTRTTRYSLRQSELQHGGTAATFKNAKEQIAKRDALESEVWAQNRTVDAESTIKRSRITIKNPDSRKAWIEQNEEPTQIKAEVANNNQ
ncbi:hypothetical protein K9L27_02595 [Candidatus Gracilibacteria bacterium]|nr:hypothetical protein [Candidatus Gracilibacteria bacterium]